MTDDIQQLHNRIAILERTIDGLNEMLTERRDEIHRLRAEIEQHRKRPPHMHPVGDLCIECNYYGTPNE